jgi:arylsulfatase A-like enzyme
MRFRTVLRLMLVVLVAICFAGPATAGGPRRPPNIVFILADDLGWTDLGCQGSKYYKTPNIDRLARQGLTFTSAYTAGPNCAPTRASLMTGRYTPRHGIYTVGTGARGEAKHRRLEPVENRTNLPLEEITVAQLLKSAGYTTGLFGKWHLGQKGPYHPSRRGFDEAIVSMGKHFNFATSPKADVKPGTYLADFLTDQAVKFIEKNRDRPFFLYLSHFAVHTPIDAKKELVAKFAKEKGAAGHDNPTYAAMIASLDESVGRVLDKLAELKLEENTIVIFSSDNGGVGGYALAGILGARDITSNRPLRAGKGTLHDGGVRVPFLVAWKGTIVPGSRCDEPIISTDFFHTCVELTGGRGKVKKVTDGVSLLPLLKSSGKAKLRRDAIFWHFPGYLEANVKKGTWRTTPAGAIRSGDWKLIEYFEDGRVELYNLKEDLGEKKNLAKAMPARAKELREKLHRWREQIQAPMPQPRVEETSTGLTRTLAAPRRRG